MTSEDSKRKLTAILSADVKGYSRLMSQDEEATVKTLKQHRATISGLVSEHRGRVIDSPGDNILAEFGSVVDAVKCAVKIQETLKGKNAELPENRRMEFRLGVNLGDVIEEEHRIYGDGVNIAARLEGLAEAGGICISGTAFDHVKNKLSVGYQYLGKQTVKNIPDPVRAYKVLMEPGAAGKVIGEEEQKRRTWGWKAAAVAILVLVAVGLVWNFYFRPPPIEPASKEKMVFPLPKEPSIAVLPFVNMSGDPKQEFFSDGLTEDIITSLSKMPNIFVIARNSTFTYKGKPVKVQQVAEELGVRYVLEGSVQRSGDRVRITVQLIDALKGYHVWSERYDTEMKDIFALQDQITLDTLKALDVKLSRGELSRAHARGTDNLEAYIKLVQGREIFMRQTRESQFQARQLIEEVIRLDPNYAIGYYFLGAVTNTDILLGLSKSPRESRMKAIELAQKAISLDDSTASAHAYLGNLYALNGEYEKGIAECTRAIEIAPNFSDGYVYSALVLNYAGRSEEAVPLIEKAFRLAPLGAPFSHYMVAAMTYGSVGRYEDALRMNKELLSRWPDNIFGQIGLVLNYEEWGHHEEAQAAVRNLVRAHPDFSIQGYARGRSHKDPTVIARELELLRKAGLPDKPPLPLPEKPSIAVLPFVNMSDDKSQEYFSDGMTEDLITDLSKISGLFVISRNSTFVYKGKPINVQQVSRELGVKYVLEGSVRRAGDQVRINAQLVDATTGQHLWAERYDGIMRDVFSLQDRINQRIVAALTIKLTPDDQNRIAKRGTEDSAAHDAFLKGWDHYLRFTSEDALKALSYFKEAVELDSNYGRALAAIALVYWHATGAQGIFPEFTKALKISWLEARLRACQYLEIAMKNPVSITHALQSERYLYLRLYEEAISEAEHALALDPNDPASHAAMANALIVAGKPNEAIDYARNGLRLDPQNPARYLNLIGKAHFFMGELKEAVNFNEDAIRHNPTIGSTSLILAASYAYLGRDQEARAVVEAHKKIWTEHVSAPFILPIIMYFNPFRSRPVADALAEGLIKAGVPGRVSDYIHGSEEDLLTGDDLREFVYPSTITGFGPGGSQWSADFATDGKVTLRAPWLPGGVDTGRSWLEGDRLCFQLPKSSFGMVYCGVTFRNPKGTPEGKNEYVRFNDIGINIFSRVR